MCNAQFPFHRSLLGCKGIGNLFDPATTKQVDGSQTDGHHHQDDEIQHAPMTLYQVFGYHHHEGPLHIFDIAIANPRRHPVDDGRYSPPLPLENHACIECVFQHAILVWMENETAVTIDDAAV